MNCNGMIPKVLFFPDRPLTDGDMSAIIHNMPQTDERIRVWHPDGHNGKPDAVIQMEKEKESNMEKKGKYGRLLTNTALFTAGKFISKLLVFFMMRLYTSCLTPDQYSTADLVVDMANLLIPLACLGISEGIFRNAAAREGNKEDFLNAGLWVLGVGSAGFLLLSPLLTLIPLFRTTAWLIVLYVLMSNLHAVVSQYLCAIGKTGLFAAQGIVNTALTVLLNILFLPILNLGVTGYVLSVVLADGLTTAFLVLCTRLWRSIRPLRRQERRPLVRSMLAFCLPLIPATLCWWVTGVSDRYMVAAMYSHAENGLYAAAYKIPTLLTYAVGIFDSAWRLSVAAEADNREACAAFYTRVWRWYTTLSFVGGAVLILGSRLFAGMLFADAYQSAWMYVPVLTVATVFMGLDTFLGSVYFACRKTTGSMITALCGAGLNLLLNWLLIPTWGAMGASVATLVSYGAVYVLRLITVRRLIPFRVEALRGTANVLLILTLCVAVTLTGGAGQLLSPTAWWLVAGGLGLVLLGVNGKALYEMGACAVRAVLRTSRKREQTADPSAPEKGDTTGS